MDVIKTVKSILSKRVNVDALKEDDALSSLGLDSLDLVEVMIEIEDAFKVEFTSEEIIELTTLKSIIDLINSKIK